MYSIYYIGLPYVQRSWRLMENSANVGGMPGLYVLKTFILVFIALVALQGLAMLIRSILVLAKRDELIPEDFRYPTIAQATGKE
jgi:TRAP-type mannitol/chloroaromatic compound transport system permease small subunit